MLLDQFATHCWSFLPVTKKTISNYKGAYNRNISHHFGSRDMNSISKREFLDVLAPLMPPNYFQTLMMLRVLYREALSRELVAESPVASIRAPRIHVQPQKFLTWEEVRDNNFGKYDSQVKFLALHGLRWGEASWCHENSCRCPPSSLLWLFQRIPENQGANSKSTRTLRSNHSLIAKDLCLFSKK